MPRLSHKTLLYGATGALGGSTAWAFVLALSGALRSGLLPEMFLGALTGMFIGGSLWSHEALTGRQFKAALKRAAYGAIAGTLGGAVGAGLGNTVFSLLGRYVADLGGFRASLGIALAAALGWAVLGAAVGASGGLMIRSRERARYGLTGGSIGGLFGGLLFNYISATNIWSALAALFLLGLCIGSFVSLIEEVFVSAKVKVIKGRHIGREFPLLKELNVIGRDDRSDVCLSGAEGVGMRHAFIKRKNGSYVIEQGEGGTGVYVNHTATKNSRLNDGDVIRVGSIILMFSAMRKAAAVVVLPILVALLWAGPVMADDAQWAQITQFDLGQFPEVKAYVSVLDKTGRPVRGLTREDMTLTENGKPVPVGDMRMSGTSGKREPLSLAVVLDRSGSMTGDKIARAKTSVIRFISLMETGDKASLFAFSDEVEEIASLTDDGEKLIHGVRAVQPGGHTALYDAIAKGVEAVKGLPGRRAVIVLSDGIANRGALDIDQAIDAATRGYVSVYVIGLGEDVRTARLERIAQETGGSYFFTPSAEGLTTIYETISKRIHNEYVVTFTTEKRAEYLRKVSLTLGPGLTAERAYFQPRSSLFGAGGRPPGWSFIIPLASIAGLMAISLRSVERQYRTGHLSLARGKGTKKEIDIGKTATIGRDERNTLGLFKDNAVEQQHAEVVKENGHYLIRDNKSAAGTFVNEKRVTGAQRLVDGDIITIGGTRIVFSEESRRTCSSCGEPMRAGAKFCPKCGKKSL
jgi:VWFA-related protein